MLPSISINNTSATYPESINENNNDEVNGLVQELKNLFNGKEGISTCIKHLLELIKNAIRVNDDPYRFNINNSSVTYIDIGSNDTDHITIGIDNQEPIELPANYKDKELVRTIINDNIVEKTHNINNKEMIFSALKEIYDGDPGFIFDKISHKLRHTVTEFDESGVDSKKICTGAALQEARTYEAEIRKRLAAYGITPQDAFSYGRSYLKNNQDTALVNLDIMTRFKNIMPTNSSR